ncbi:hypothetical protein AB1L30_00865, partial [Bremerella sp. JC817]
PHDMAVVRDLERTANVPPVVAQLLICRGIRDAESAREFLDAKIAEAVKQKDDIVMPEFDGIFGLENIMEFDANAKIVMVSVLGYHRKCYRE